MATWMSSIMLPGIVGEKGGGTWSMMKYHYGDLLGMETLPEKGGVHPAQISKLRNCQPVPGVDRPSTLSLTDQVIYFTLLPDIDVTLTTQASSDWSMAVHGLRSSTY